MSACFVSGQEKGKGFHSFLSTMTCTVKIGIIGGTGLDDPDLLENRQEQFVDTPFGKPSDALITGKIKGVDCVLLARHGRKHNVNPTFVNYRANIHALKAAGCTHIVVTTACGSLQENIHPGDIVLLDQFIDRTTKRHLSFYDNSVPEYAGVCHIPMHTPFCKDTRKIMLESLKSLNIPHHESGTTVTIEGPRFSTKAESHLYRSWGATIVNMTSVPEVSLAKEAGLCYAAAALVTDYDCWKDGEEGHVDVASVMEIMRSNAQKAKSLFLDLIPRIAAIDWTPVIKARQDEAKNSVM